MGNVHYPLTAQIADTIATHGLAWAVRHYAKRMPAWQLRVFMRGALGI